MRKLLVGVGVVVLLSGLLYSGHSRIEIAGRTLDGVPVTITMDTWAPRLVGLVNPIDPASPSTSKSSYEAILKMKVMILLAPLSVKQLQGNEDTFKWLLAGKAQEYGFYLVRVKVVLPPDVVEKLKKSQAASGLSARAKEELLRPFHLSSGL
ncbi:MAG: hypothetical protein Q8R91_06015 [Candidatus Omnitrophota bacterium]|nr:hypothetical protein [Candidatus Omnitrophota bacterium]